MKINNVGKLILLLTQATAMVLTALCVWQLLLWWLPTSQQTYAPLIQFSANKTLPVPVVPDALAGSFGREGQPVKVTNQPVEKPAPKVKQVLTVADVNILVVGIVMMPIKEKSRAILSVRGAPTKIYQVGDELQRQMTLTQINPKSLLVERNGDTIELLFSQPKPLQESPASKQNLADNSTLQNSSSGLNSTIVIDAQLKDLLVQNPVQATQYILAAPEFRNGKMHGYRLRKGRKGEVFDQTGFQEGDVLTHIDSDHVSQISAGQFLGGDILSRTSIPITIERQGRSMSLEVKIQ